MYTASCRQKGIARLSQLSNSQYAIHMHQYSAAMPQTLTHRPPAPCSGSTAALCRTASTRAQRQMSTLPTRCCPAALFLQTCAAPNFRPAVPMTRSATMPSPGGRSPQVGGGASVAAKGSGCSWRHPAAAVQGCSVAGLAAPWASGSCDLQDT